MFNQSQSHCSTHSSALHVWMIYIKAPRRYLKSQMVPRYTCHTMLLPIHMCLHHSLFYKVSTVRDWQELKAKQSICINMV